ncbi:MULTISPECIES: plasmid mobilization protein [Micromonospora]|uniref:plasmid mobilization protein n=1 Tax=Micromonospora TaxID=1873 RepID=UPI000C8879AE|nr:hypothetical protein [Verrucosispora sp. ts21]PMR61352.1 hypothetical protein C1A38_09455 [Verrucosispora sp. ts21]
MDEHQKRAIPAARHRTHSRPGRPHAILIRLSDDEKRLLEVAAESAGLTPTGYAAKMAVEAATGQESNAASGDLRELQRELFAARRAVNMFGSNVNQVAAAWHSTGELPEWAAEAVRLCARAVDRLDQLTARIHRRLR